MPSVPVRTRSAQWFRGTFAREKCRVTLQKQPAKGNLPCVHARPVGSFSAGLLLLNKSVRLFCALLQSPSTRRVWIEIAEAKSGIAFGASHPPRGGCGLKLLSEQPEPQGLESPSTRRVWIEIAIKAALLLGNIVTLHAEGVD